MRWIRRFALAGRTTTFWAFVAVLSQQNTYQTYLKMPQPKIIFFSSSALIDGVDDPVNKKSLEAIESSMFLLCLDTSPVPVIESVDETDEAAMLAADNDAEEDILCAYHRDDKLLAQQMLHGMGSKLNGANRWYDKTMQVGEPIFIRASALQPFESASLAG
ncbi:unnamed protein product [Schistocephalus solidus]|uniref:Carn_acyltransf domain-containing protein n=1 Tax=Schistocephalus solidus TaxID=70667 RepID=A0A183SIA3_SCHSO|nr:unnamed protein product [Schistocephalus solidus]